MNREVQDSVLKVVEDQITKNKIKYFHVTWFGGEPLIGKKPLLRLSDSFIEMCQKHNVNYQASLVTNGYLLDEETCVDIKQRSINNAQVTLDGPPDIHDRMRPLLNEKGTFWKIISNLHHAIKYLDIDIRVNLDKQNFQHVERLFEILSSEGFVGKLGVTPGQIVGVDDGALSPSATYRGSCFKNKEFAQAELQFNSLARAYGFSSSFLPPAKGTPCTAVRANEMVIGVNGEIYKCWESVGNPSEVYGNIRDYESQKGRLNKWLKYDPFADPECHNCVALPGCMGGCAHHAMDLNQYENRCGTFRHTYREQILNFIRNNKNKIGNTDVISINQLTHVMETR